MPTSEDFNGYIFTDGSSRPILGKEIKVAGWGLVVLDLCGNVKTIYKGTVPKPWPPTSPAA
eukprot:2859301-Prorocentrum_lima.AAC.1